jgi:hypothetical protein
VLACHLAQAKSLLQDVQHHLSLELEAEPPMPCHGVLSYKPARLVQSGGRLRVQLPEFTPKLADHNIEITYLLQALWWASIMGRMYVSPLAKLRGPLQRIAIRSRLGKHQSEVN